MVLNDSYGVVHNTDMNDPQPIDPRRRIRELNAIPERDRTDEQWDELNELEIRTAPGNRVSDRQPDGLQEKRPRSGMQGGRRPDRNQGPRNNGPRQDTRPPDGRSPDSRPQEARTDRPPKPRQHRRPKRPVDSPNGGGNSGNSGNSGAAGSGDHGGTGGNDGGGGAS